MPNWVTIHMVVNGKADRVKKFIELNQVTEVELDMDGNPQLDTDGITQKTYVQKLTFAAAVPRPIDDPKYRVYPDAEGHLRISKEFPKTEPDGRVSYFDWWKFNTEQWGTKWDACDVEIGEVSEASDGTAEVDYDFQTAWSFPEPWFIELAKQWSDLDIDIYASEEDHQFYLAGHARNGEAELNFMDYDDVFVTPTGEDFVNLVKEQMEKYDLNPDDYDFENLDETDDEINSAIYLSFTEDLVSPENSDLDVYIEDEDGFKAALEKYKKK